MKGKILGIGAMVIVLLLSFSLPAFALYQISVPFEDASFDLLSMSYYLNATGSKVAFGTDTAVWNTSPSTAMQFYVPGCTGLVPAFKYTGADSFHSWEAGEIMTLSMTIMDMTYSAEFVEDPSEYRIVLQNGDYSLNFAASSVTYANTASSGYRGITVNFAATQALQTSIAVSGAVFQFYLPFSLPNGTGEYITVNFGDINLSSTDGLENINTEKIVDAVEGAVVEDFGYTTPDDQSSSMVSLEDNIGHINGWIEDLNDFKSDYSSFINSAVSDSIGAFDFLWCWFDISWLSLLIVSFAMLLLIRKIVK